MSGAMRRPALLLLCCCAALLAACGWQLRGSVDLPPELSPVFVGGGGAVGRSIDSRLSGGGVPMTATPASAGLQIRVLSENRSSRVVAVDQDGKALAYELLYRVRFAVSDGQGQELITPQELRLERTFDDNPDVSVLGKNLEQDIIYQELADDIADQVILRLRALVADWRPDVARAARPAPSA